MSEPSGEPSPTDDWRAVTPAESTAGPTPPMPAWVKPAIAGGIALLMLAAWFIGASLGGGNTPAPEPEPSPSPTPVISMEPPLVVDAYVRGQSNEPSAEATSQRIIQADYTDGEDTVVFIMTWPESDVNAFLNNAGIADATESETLPGRYCGTSQDTGEAACGEVVDDVGLLLVSVSEQGQPVISTLLDSFKEELGQ